MHSTVEHLTQQAVQLPEDQRLTLVSRILATVEPPVTAEIEEAWNLEIQKRIANFKEVRSKAIPAEEVFSKIRKILKK